MRRREEQRLLVFRTLVSEARRGAGIGSANVFVQSTGTGEEMCEVESHFWVCCAVLRATGPRFACDRAGG
jgi:hypothetical protein